MTTGPATYSTGPASFTRARRGIRRRYLYFFGRLTRYAGHSGCRRPVTSLLKRRQPHFFEAGFPPPGLGLAAALLRKRPLTALQRRRHSLNNCSNRLKRKFFFTQGFFSNAVRSVSDNSEHGIGGMDSASQITDRVSTDDGR